jgi:L-threonylcarbamoyladenylate synthase
MRRINLDDPTAAQTVTDVLGCDGVVVLPTDTLFGLSAALASRRGYDRITTIKRGNASRRFVCVASSIDMVSRYVGDWGCTSEDDLRRIWPAGLTAVLPSAPHVPDWVGNTIAMRVPDVPDLMRILDHFGQPVLSTSVNRGGKPPHTTADSIEEEFGEEIDLIVVPSSPYVETAASTIVDFTGDKARVIRRGAYAWPTAENPSK